MVRGGWSEWGGVNPARSSTLNSEGGSSGPQFKQFQLPDRKSRNSTMLCQNRLLTTARTAFGRLLSSGIEGAHGSLTPVRPPAD